MDHEVSVINQETDNGQQYLATVLSAERDQRTWNLSGTYHLDEKIGHVPIKKMRIKVSQKGLSTRLVAQTGSSLRIQQRGKACWALELEILYKRTFKVDYHLMSGKKGVEEREGYE